MNTNLTCIIVDDEPPAIRLLEKFVKKVPFLDLKQTFKKSLEALAYIELNKVDVVFLDIQMPQLTGIQLSRIIPSGTKVIFTTAYPDFALESYDISAVDYLLKPIEFERFYRAVSKLKLEKQGYKEEQTDKEEYVFLKTDGKNRFCKVFLKDILFVEGLKNYVSVQTRNEQIITYSALKNMFEILPEYRFVQVHRSFIVALEHIDKIVNDSIFIDKYQVSVGNTFKKAFFARIIDKSVIYR